MAQRRISLQSDTLFHPLFFSLSARERKKSNIIHLRRISKIGLTAYSMCTEDRIMCLIWIRQLCGGAALYYMTQACIWC